MTRAIIFCAAMWAAIAASAQDRCVILTWTASTSADAQAYTIYRSTTPGGPYIRIGATSALRLGYVDRTVALGVTYYYVVKAAKIADVDGITTEIESDPSNEATAAIPVSAGQPGGCAKPKSSNGRTTFSGSGSVQ